MYTIRSYKKVKSLEEAYELNQKKSSAIIGGGMWIRLGNRTIGTAIDLSELGLDKIEETEDEFEIGCMATLRDLECHKGLNSYFHGMFAEAMKGIVGTQFRNTASIGGSIYRRLGFSDPLTLLLSLETTVELYHAGCVSLDEFVKMPYDRDILVKLHIKKNNARVAYQCLRITKTDFPVLTVAASKADGQWKIAVGARPHKALTAACAAKLGAHPDQGESDAIAHEVSETMVFGSNMRAGSEYRKLLAEVLTKRAIEDVIAQEVPSNGN